MVSHFLLLALFSFFVSLIFAVLTRDDPGDQLRFGALMFAGLTGSAIVLGWLMFPLPL